MSNESSFAPAHLVNEMDLRMGEAQAAATLLQTADEGAFSGRYVAFEGRQLLNFVCCSYLGLEQREDLKRAAISAIERLGVQFSCSRAVLQSSQYGELEEALGLMTGGKAIVSATTTLAHISALPVLVGPRDAVVIDQQAHASLHTACALLRVPIDIVRHSRMDQLETRVRDLSAKHERVWYVLDGLYSMLGDFAPIDAIRDLLERYPALHLYVDDAHSTSWSGTHGRGYALERLPDRSRVIGVLSLNKAFSAGGGALILPDDHTAQRIRRAGGPLVFGGPLQPPLLAAAVASAKLHLSPELPTLQAALDERIQYFIKLCDEQDVPLADRSISPIFFLRCRSTEKTFSMIKGLRETYGIYTCPAFFPIVPKGQAGVRITISLHNTLDDIRGLVEALAAESQRLELNRASGSRFMNAAEAATGSSKAS
ncbi:MAG: aminotransferase class I/II-fold pyridoxal phosphate-dependent enzyme [Polyangiaceae bacterium]